ncbi:OmpA family protein [Nitratireductor sp. GISD-1A_MAKvit]|uniref:OmpA family protein n=1 Tax=Nitratireductor sp. GISD-1A_MAKvit TaxID=3234198 RepID=UPI0034660D1A
MLNRRQLLGATIAASLMPSVVMAQSSMPSASRIQRSLEAAPTTRIRPQDRVTVRELKRRPDLRRRAPSIDIQAINFGFDSAAVPHSQFRKVEEIANALLRLRRRRPRTVVLLEGHTDAVGSFGYNQRLSERRAVSLRRVLVREFGVPARMLETVGYGEEFLLIPTPHEDWRNRRVTLRRVDDFLR